MSASAMLVSICICARSLAIWKSVGVLKLAATVWPSSTLRATTMPEMGERITVYCRLVLSRDTCAFTSSTWAWAASSSFTAVSSSACEMKPLPTSERVRASFVSARRSDALALLRFAMLWASAALNSEGSSSARSWPSFTTLL